MFAHIKMNEMLSFTAKMIEEIILGEKFRHKRIKITYSKIHKIIKKLNKVSTKTFQKW